MARRLASAGYAVALPDLYHRTTETADSPGEPGRWPSPERLGNEEPAYREVIYRHMQAVTARSVEADVATLLSGVADDAGIASHRFGVFGYCMSGPFAMTLAAAFGDRVAAAASIHGVRLCHAGQHSPHRLLSSIPAELYFACAAQDDWAPPAVVDLLDAALRERVAPSRLDWYPNTEHGFVFPDRGERYVEAAAERHWAALHDLFRRNLFPLDQG